MKGCKLIIKLLLLLLVLILAVGFYYNYSISAVSSKSEAVTLEIKDGSTAYSVGNILYDNKLIRNKFIYKLYVKLNKVENIKASTYEFNRNMKLKDIIAMLEEGNSYNPDQITITFKEGLNVRKIAKLVASETNNSYDDFMKLMNDKEYIDSLIAKYWFLTDSIKNSKIYYPLEGYLFPETYAFLNKDVTPKEIVETMLDEEEKQLDKYKDKIKEVTASGAIDSVHKLITLASIVELEGASADDRASVAGVFYNRIKDRWVLGSDVTTYYYLKIDDFKQSLNGNPNLYTCDNAYNTRCTSFVGLPVGPISNPGHESIDAVINYKKHNYYYFVADCKGKTYLSKDSTEHYNTIQKLQNEGNWCV